MTKTEIADANGVGRKDVYTKVTERIISDLEQSVRPWMKPWSGDHAGGRITRPLRHNGTPYRGMNILLLWGEAMANGYAAPIWMTYKQAQELGANVRKGEHGSLVVYANTISKTETNEQGEDIEREIPFMKGYTVFNVEQVDGLARALLRAAGKSPAIIGAHRTRGRLHYRHQRHHPARR
jgi:antirestriction protein ArdC